MINFFPKRSRYKKTFKVRNKFSTKKLKTQSCVLKYGNCGLKATQDGLLTSRHFETIRAFLKRYLKKKSIIWFRFIPYISVTTKAVGIRMGKGKGNASHWVYPIKSGQIMFEVNIEKNLKNDKILNECISKLPFNMKITWLHI